MEAEERVKRAQEQYGSRDFNQEVEDKKYFFNLPKFALDKLRKLEIAGAEWIGHCTYHQSDKFYSYRRSQHLGELDYGRQIYSIKI